ncbi:hypothetical protein [Phaeodactylibacter sp.]|uniref:hypothetical protein n=1 Tax=Phaeodactylibacter sp. TaxID=1940289 RepID=UPI0025F332BC|nr:hypothetical protein [Phaeodactylibacter sp.]MCI4647123.1 hypothetical protein [Phaeodactylibacter sp.]MCI5092591.1 hypothetical protein [Phaeodactylibacter sp.]
MKYLWLTCLGLCLGVSNLAAQSDFTGNWLTSFTDQEGQTWKMQVEMKADNTYAVDFNADGTTEIEGSYDIEGDQMTVQDVKGSDCNGKGIYKFTVEGDQLTMLAVKDECPGRSGPEGRMVFSRM